MHSLDFFPLAAGRSYRYRLTSSDLDDVQFVEIRLLSVSADHAGAIAQAELTREASGAKQPRKYRVVRDAGRLRSDDGVLGGPRTEFPIPPVVGASWTDPPDRHEITSLEEEVEVPAGRFSGCLRVLTLLAGGDAGSGSRLYAPGVGLVYEDVSSESGGAQVRLESYGTQ